MTPAELITTMQDNADYDLEQSLPKAKAFITACRQFLSMALTEGEQDDQRTRLDLEQVRKNMDHALRWYHARTGGDTGVSFIDLRYPGT